MQYLHRSVFAGLAGLALAFSMIAGDARAAPAVNKDTVVMALRAEIYNLDPLVTATGDSQRWGLQMYDSLYTFDSKGKLLPQLATSYKISDDGLHYTYVLRDGVKFHNGDALSSADVKFSMDWILNPKTKSTRRPQFAQLIESVDTPDARTVVFNLRTRDGAFLNKIAGYLFIIPKAYCEKLAAPEDFAKAPVGSGPFKFVEQQIGQFTKIERFDGYWGPKPQVKTIIYKVIPEPTSRVNALLSGEVDISEGIPTNQVASLKKEAGIDVLPTPIGSPLAVRLYSDDPESPLSKRDVRLALNYAIDVNAIIKSVFHGIGAPMATYISKYYPIGVDPALQPYGYDPKKAKALLAAAGYPNGFEIKMYSASDMPKELAEAVVAYWSQVGVRARVQYMDYAAWSRINNTHATAPMTIMQFSNAIWDPLHPVQGAAAKDGTWSNYSNPEVEKLLLQAQGTEDAAGRDRIFKQIGRVLHDDAQSVLITELFYVFGKKRDLEWEPQSGIAWYNLRNLKWK